MSRGEAAPSVARRVARQAAAILVLTLLGVGIATGAIAYVQQRKALDQLLLAAALGDAHPAIGGWEVEHLAAPVETWIVRQGDLRVPAALVDEARRQQGTLYANVGDQRLVLLTVEGENEDEEHDEGAEHRRSYLLVAASAPAVTVRGSVGAFAVIYTGVGLLAALAAGFALWGSVQAAFLPLALASTEASKVTTLGQGTRLTETGPSEIRLLLVSMNALLDRLDAAYTAQGRFTAEAAHELRTPVATMLGEIDVALRHPRSAEQYRGILESTREEVQRLARLVAGLTALARLDAGQAEGNREPIRAAELARLAWVAEQARLDAVGCQVRIHAEVDPEISVHRALLEIALGNLLRNASSHAPGQPVDVWIRQEGAFVAFDVEDGGPGVPEADREALFDRFVRGARARRSDRAGMGLGLPIARQVARRHGGDCSLSEAPSGGLRARLTLPLNGVNV